MILSETFRDFIASLEKCKVRYLLIGAHALAAHGVPRNTGDLDIFVEPSEENSRRVLEALEDFGLPGTVEDPRAFAVGNRIASFGVIPNRIDILTGIAGVDFQAAWDGHIRLETPEFSLNIIGKSDLIRNKEATGRDKDAVDVKLLKMRP